MDVGRGAALARRSAGLVIGILFGRAINTAGWVQGPSSATCPAHAAHALQLYCKRRTRTGQVRTQPRAPSPEPRARSDAIRARHRVAALAMMTNSAMTAMNKLPTLARTAPRCGRQYISAAARASPSLSLLNRHNQLSQPRPRSQQLRPLHQHQAPTMADQLYIAETPAEVKEAKGLHLITQSTPNGQAVQIFLEELADAYGLTWTTSLINIMTNEQKKECMFTSQ